VPLYLKFYFWLLLVSVLVFAIERIFSSAPKQEVFRDGFGQDLFWLVFNTQYVSWMLATVSVYTISWLNAAFFHFGLPSPESIGLIAGWPPGLQFIVFFVLKDFIDWNVHRTLHRVPWLWEFHKLHHSIERLDWLTTFRAHWAEAVIYKFAVYLPLVVLGVDERVIFAILVVSLLIQELIHANLKWDWGPFRYVLNSPGLHAWHHAVEMHGAGGQNFAITFTVWDWLFGTAYFPRDGSPPSALGFSELKQFPSGIWGRIWSPFTRRSRSSEKPPVP
jgi:sterol desaturase/sphingolipid hydroxylase (fatty acid hydroxylase superfamily)